MDPIDMICFAVLALSAVPMVVYYVLNFITGRK